MTARARDCLDLPALGRAVEARRRERGMSYLAVAREAGICTVNLAQRLEGGGSLSAETFVRLLGWLGETDVGPYVVAGVVAVGDGG